MLRPVLEIYIVWHPADPRGKDIAVEFVEHFHGSVYTGLLGGAVEVFVRSMGWAAAGDAPRPIPCAGTPLPNGIGQSEFTVIVPLMGIEMAVAIEGKSGSWRDYIENIARMQQENPTRVGVFPYLIDQDATNNTELGGILGKYQCIASSSAEREEETQITLRCRDLAQGIAQLLSGNDEQRLTIFISHTKRSGLNEKENVSSLIDMIRQLIANTRLQVFFDTSDLQPGHDWDEGLRKNAARSALLALRTDLYSSREWCQREISIAKREGMPVVILDALDLGERRGSFLMDHVPRVPVRMRGSYWQRQDIYRALNLLVDECLKRKLWMHQKAMSQDKRKLGIMWWAPHAPEPLTLVQWLEAAKKSGTLPAAGSVVRILHPDPPLGADEKLVLDQMLSFIRGDYELDIMTPRLLSARGG